MGTSATSLSPGEWAGVYSSVGAGMVFTPGEGAERGHVRHEHRLFFSPRESMGVHSSLGAA